ncbi:MAG: tetratricopeptide repeat protein [Pyrinomonadaceae bacterium]
MKRCPECGRDYNDDSLIFCLDDGSELLFGPKSFDEPQTAILHSTDVPGEAATRAQIHTTEQTAVLPSGVEEVPRSSGFDRRLMIIPLALLIVALAGYFGYRYFGPFGLTQINSIAVMPFENRNSDADTDYLSDGLAESLIYRLSQLPDLKVSPTSSVLRYKGKQTDPNTIAQELGVDSVLTGRIVQRGDDLNISVELVDVRSNKLIWGEKYERKMSELLTTQRQITTEISQNLKLKLSGNEKGLKKPYTNSNEAYQLYLKGRYHLAKRTKDDMLRAMEYYRQATKLDPNFALAQAQIAEVYVGLPAYPFLTPKEAIPQAKAAALRAIEIDPTLAEGHIYLGYVLSVYEWNWEEAGREFKRAIELDPNNADTYFRYGHVYLSPLGRHDEAIRAVSRALELEPLDLLKGVVLSEMFHVSGQDDKAIEQAKKILELEPDFVLGSHNLSQALITKGKYQEALEVCEKSLSKNPNSQLILQLVGYAYAKTGRREDAEKIIEKFREIARAEYVQSYHIASIYVALGDHDKAFAELQKSAENRDWEFHQLNVDPLMNPLRGDPRFNVMIGRLNLPE